MSDVFTSSKQTSTRNLNCSHPGVFEKISKRRFHVGILNMLGWMAGVFVGILLGCIEWCCVYFVCALMDEGKRF